MSTVTAKNLQANLPIGAIQTAAAFGATGGSVSADITELKLDDGLPVVADGSLEIVGLTLPMVQREPLGGFKAEMFTTETGISASIEDTAAVIDLAGSLQLANDGAYEFIAQIGASERTSPQLREQLKFIGAANERGQYEIDYSGRL